MERKKKPTQKLCLAQRTSRRRRVRKKQRKLRKDSFNRKMAYSFFVPIATTAQRGEIFHVKLQTLHDSTGKGVAGGNAGRGGGGGGGGGVLRLITKDLVKARPKSRTGRLHISNAHRCTKRIGRKKKKCKKRTTME